MTKFFVIARGLIFYIVLTAFTLGGFFYGWTWASNFITGVSFIVFVVHVMRWLSTPDEIKELDKKATSKEQIPFLVVKFGHFGLIASLLFAGWWWSAAIWVVNLFVAAHIRMIQEKSMTKVVA